VKHIRESFPKTFSELFFANKHKKKLLQKQKMKTGIEEVDKSV
jgi:hypothetical protein